MITISLCMIVKNEERILSRCLDSVCDLVDEIIIVDTGSSDATKDIAAKYTDKIFDFRWIDDFSAARNFAFSKATKDYIYSADADEVIDEVNKERFRKLREAMDGGIDIVQMKYGNQLQHGTVYNFNEEYRPKLFKRLREFTWIEPIHETVRIDPIVFDSDIVITHLPEENHSGRDLKNFEKQIKEGKVLSDRLFCMYARECYLNAEGDSLFFAADYFADVIAKETLKQDAFYGGISVIVKAKRLISDISGMFKYAMKVIAGDGCSEVCCELGSFYESAGDFDEACIWYYNAVYETTPILSIKSGREDAIKGLIRCYEALGISEQADIYRQELAQMVDR